MNSLLRVTAALGALGLLVGACDTAPKPANGAPQGVVLIPPAQVHALVQGMSMAQVLGLLGSPHQKRAYPPGGPAAEIWIYRLSSSEGVTMVAVSTQAVPASDPLTGQTVTRQEPVYQNQHLVTYQTLELLFLDGLLTQRSTGRDVERWFD